MNNNIKTLQQIFVEYVGEDNPIPREIVEEITTEYSKHSVISNEYLCYLMAASENATNGFHFED